MIIIIIVYFPIRYKYNLLMHFCDFTQSSEKRLIPEPLGYIPWNWDA